MSDVDRVEAVAAYLHEIWARWFIHQHKAELLQNTADLDRWSAQSITTYDGLNEQDKEKDRKLARDFLRRLREARLMA